ncbi:2OG-Fe(II) oxygenase [Lichenicoccus sp.]|uniref:2OG-Fe(II) oxygenase n=1 Tax=Lichenicoccus sp. TaxID=2781899 RepID=UPI003D0BC735
MVRLTPGDRLPFCIGVGTDRQFYSSDLQAGRAAILVLGGSGAPQEYDPVLALLAGRRGEVAALNADLLVLLGFDALARVHAQGAASAHGLRVILCGDTSQAAYCAQLELPALVVIDRAGRLTHLAAIRASDPALLVAEAMAALGPLCRAADSPVGAPVLALPGLLDPALCHRLVSGFGAAATYDSGMSGSDANGLVQDRIDHARKCRTDWMLQPGDGVHERVTDLLGRRCVPEIRRAFHSEVAHIDRILVVRYDAGVGHFGRHRDNSTAALAFRQFAVSINLGCLPFEGGRVVFPEYGDEEYCPASGEGIVFSSSLLHEVTRVRRGCRYALLTFLHDADAEARRLERVTAGSAPLLH